MSNDSDKTNTEKRKIKVLNALVDSVGVVTTACKSAGIHRCTFYEWYNSDNEFKKQVDDIKDSAVDIVESELIKQIRSGNHVSTIFYLKTKGKDKGFQEKQEIENKISGNLSLEQITGIEIK